MSVINFFMDNREGHLLPSLWLAGELAKEGHQIIYWSTLDNEALIKEQGFGFRAIFTDIYPRGFNRMVKLRPDMDSVLLERRSRHLAAMLKDGMDGLLTEGGLCVGSSFLNIEMLLLHYRYGISPVLFTAYMRAPGTTLYDECIKDVLDLPGDIMEEILFFADRHGVVVRSLDDLLSPLWGFPELRTFPPEFDPDAASAGQGIHFIGPCVRREGKGSGLEVLTAAGTRKIIYCSLGSYAASYGEVCEHFYRILLNVLRMPSCAELYLLLATGPEYAIRRLEPVPENVMIVQWASQPEILAVSSLCITHGGIGTLQESIYYGVPMIVFPIRYDQPGNARLVCGHGVGVMGDIVRVNEELLLREIMHVLNSNAIGENVRKMQQLFRERESQRAGVQIVSKLARETFRKNRSDNSYNR